MRAAQLNDGRDQDVADARADHILAFLGDEPIGTCRLIYPAKAHPLPSEAVEVGRVVVIRPTVQEHRSVLAGLIGAAWLELRAKGYCRISGTVSAPMLRLYRRLGFVLQVVGPPVNTLGEERFPILFEPSSEAADMAVARHSPAFGSA